MEENKDIAAEMIVDMYEMRVSTFHKYMEKSEKVQDAFKYNFFNVIIATLCDKYGVDEDRIREVIYKRQISEIGK